MTCDSRRYAELFIVFITAESCEVVSLCIKEERVEVVLCGFYRRGLAGAELSVNLEQSFFCILGRVLFSDCLDDTGVFAEKVDKVVIRADTERTDKGGCGDFSVFIYTDIENVV